MTQLAIPTPARLVAPLTAALAIFLAIGCGGDESPSTNAASEETTLDTCKLLTPTEIEETLGKKPGKPVREELMTPGAEKCRWPSADGSEFQLAQIIFHPRAPATYEAWLESYKAGMGDDFSQEDLDRMYQRIDGFGDYALYLDAEALGGTLDVVSGGRRLSVSAGGGPGATMLESCKTLARRAMDRLP